MTDFHDRVANAVSFLDTLGDVVRVVAHLDSDGLCAAAIVKTALERVGKQVDVLILAQVSKASLKGLDDVPSVFVDAGSSHLPTIIDHFTRPVIVLDHHKPAVTETPEHIFLLNPLLDALDGGREVCSASVAFTYAEAIDKKNLDMAALGVVGIIADSQEKGGVVGFNKHVLDVAVKKKLIEVHMGLRLFGAETKSVAKLLAQSYDLKLDGITGDLRGAKGFLRELDIKERDGDNWRKWNDLSEDERTKITNAIIELKGSSEGLYVEQYILVKEESGPTRDARQFATLLNACGRLEKGEMGLAIALGDVHARKQSLDILAEYKLALNRAMRWYERAQPPYVQKNEGLILINAGRQVLPAIAGTMCSILTRGKMVDPGTVVCALARYEDGMTKISLRCAGEGPDLRELLERLVALVDGESGGHRTAAGGIIPSEREDEFLQALRGAL